MAENRRRLSSTIAEVASGHPVFLKQAALLPGQHLQSRFQKRNPGAQPKGRAGHLKGLNGKKAFCVHFFAKVAFTFCQMTNQ
jgi:hypothetical protein